MVTGGGTAGHVTPLLAVADELKASNPSVQLRYIGQRGDKLASIIQDYPAIQKEYRIYAGKLRRFHGKSLGWYFTQPRMFLLNVRDLFLFNLGIMQSFFILLFWRPKVVFVKGGFVGLPVGLAAIVLRIPIITHDSDAHPGLANRILSKYVTKIAVGQPVEFYPQYPVTKLVYCGVPVLQDFINPLSKEQAKKMLSIPVDARVITVIGGSLGAVRLNKAVLKELDNIMKDDMYLVWVCGGNNYQELEIAVNAKPYASSILLMSYTNELPAVLSASDLVVTRAGATSLAELAIMKKPIIIVPNAMLTGGHQVKNARIYHDKHAAFVLGEPALKSNSAILSQSITRILDNKMLMESLEAELYTFAEPEASKNIARLIMNVADRENS